VSDDAAKRVVEEGYDRVALRYAELEGEETWPRMRWVRRVLAELPDASFDAVFSFYAIDHGRVMSTRRCSARSTAG
jgi:hypothetical protein